MGQCNHKGPSLTWGAWPRSTPEGNADKTRKRTASERQINWLPGLFAVKMVWQQISLTIRLVHQASTPANKRR